MASTLRRFLTLLLDFCFVVEQFRHNEQSPQTNLPNQQVLRLKAPPTWVGSSSSVPPSRPPRFLFPFFFPYVTFPPPFFTSNQRIPHISGSHIAADSISQRRCVFFFLLLPPEPNSYHIYIRVFFTMVANSYHMSHSHFFSGSSPTRAQFFPDATLPLVP